MLAASALASPIPVEKEVPLAQWQPAVGDRFVVDTQSNMGYLIHTDDRYTQFPVITGQRRTLNYIGRTYFGATPNWDWEVKSKDIKGDHFTFGPTGRFLRLYKDDERTAYGIHEHAAEEVMFEKDTRFQSMGCVIVRTKLLDIIEQTYNLNEGSLLVKTQYGIEDPLQVAISD